MLVTRIRRCTITITTATTNSSSCGSSSTRNRIVVRWWIIRTLHGVWMTIIVILRQTTFFVEIVTEIRFLAVAESSWMEFAVVRRRKKVLTITRPGRGMTLLLIL